MADHATSDSPTVQAELDRLGALSPGADTLGLERVSALLARLGNPERALPPVFHVAGTNGKGSTCAFLRAAIEAEGLTAHVYTSPHLVRFNERIRIAGRLIADDALAALLAQVLDVADGIAPSFFEVTTAAAFLAFARARADACIVEVGLGGRLDATNVVAAPAVCGIAQLGIDHQAFLGTTIADMAWEKAGIAKPGVPLVVLAQPEAAMARTVAAAQAAHAPLLVEGRDWTVDPALRPVLPGAHQIRNAGLAAAMLHAQRAVAVSEDAIRRGTASARWPARLQRLGPGPLRDRLGDDATLIVDGAHNPAAATAVAEALVPGSRLVIGLLANKDAAGILESLAPRAAALIFVPVSGHASHDPAALACQYGGTAQPTLEAALDALAGDGGPVAVIGSLYLAGEALRLNRQYPD